ncbi:hypothetical protein KOR34_17710 [Posidoniimonas corsicana]|uniref:Uncharacterized protein n=1 Tax=Posidoniimonas corsicana TaxID=1938618 RepID=A0A5C5VDY8_9BACT|nr:hypothetical protein [Posidoniimonas corsicana]TWT36826.1 hypothetical protein KOR34_17710 [Posidoniimonas corsicana]
MAIAGTALHSPFDLRSLQDGLGRVNHQPVSVHSFTNKRFTVNFRAPIDQVRKLLHAAIEPDEIPSTGLGMFGMCACDFWVNRLGWLPIPRIRNNDMLFRVSARIRKGGRSHRAFYTIGSNSSSRLLGFLGQRFSHFRKRVSDFQRVDNGAEYSLQCIDPDPLARGQLCAEMDSVSKERPETTVFSDIQDATEFVFNVDGSCGYSFAKDRLSFQPIDYPEWDMYFCHGCTYRFPLLDHLVQSLGIDAEFDSVLFMQNTRQTWCSSWLYPSRAA